VVGCVVDETSVPKKGRHSVGVARQHCGVLGKEAACQVAVSVNLANCSLSVPAGWRLYLPKEWATDPERCARAGVPPEFGFRKKWEIALDHYEGHNWRGFHHHAVLCIAAYAFLAAERHDPASITTQHRTRPRPRPGPAPLPHLPRQPQSTRMTRWYQETCRPVMTWTRKSTMAITSNA
jgi:SRSO17 transposase